MNPKTLINPYILLIGALKTNRVIFPKGHERLGIKLNRFALSLNIEDFDLVTVKNKQYYIYNYIGNLKDRKNVSITLSYPKDAFQNDGALKIFISLDTSLEPLDILTQYTDRWAIEPFFRDCKTYLGLDGYKAAKKDLEKSKVRYIYDAAANGRPIEEIFESLKIAY